MPESVIDYACRTLDEKEGRRQAKEAVLEALVASDIPVDARRQVLAKMAELGF